MGKAKTAKGELLDHAVVLEHGATEAIARMRAEWGNDVSVRKYARTVRADGVAIAVWVIVVRERVA